MFDLSMLEQADVETRWAESGRPGMGAFPDMSTPTTNPILVLAQWVNEADRLSSEYPEFKKKHGLALSFIKQDQSRITNLAKTKTMEELRQMAVQITRVYANQMRQMEADAKQLAVQSQYTYSTLEPMGPFLPGTQPSAPSGRPSAPVTETDYTQPTGSNKPVWFESLSEALKAVQAGMTEYGKVQQQQMALKLMQRQQQNQQNYLPDDAEKRYNWPWETWTTGTKVLVGLGVGLAGIAVLMALTGRRGGGTPAVTYAPALPAPAVQLALPAPR